MKVTRAVIQDLLPAYVAGEASADSAALVEEFLRQDAELARMAEMLRGGLPALPEELGPTGEKETLLMTKRMLGWRGRLLGLAIFLTMLPMSFGRLGGRRWTFIESAPVAVTALIWLTAVAAWIGFVVVRRRLRVTGI